MSNLIVRGRYMIAPEAGAKAKAHTRVTNFAKKLEDSYNLTLWGKRMVLAGAAQRPDIVASTLAAGDDRDALNALCETAMDAAKANVRREMGTALHSLCEQADQGLTVNMPSPYREDIDAYVSCMKAIGAKVIRMEEVVVVPHLNVAGRFDRLVEIDGTTYVLDIKTGQRLDYSWQSIAIQLAIYASAATIYDPEAQAHEPMPEVDQSRGIVIHLAAGEAKAIAYWVDLEVGRRGIDLTKLVLGCRSTKSIAQQFEQPADERSWVVDRVATIVAAGHGGDLVAAWPDDLPTLRASDAHTTAQLDEIAQLCTVVEAKHRMAFPVDRISHGVATIPIYI